MNHPGIEKIYFIKSSETSFPVNFAPGMTLSLAGCLAGSLTELTFEPGTFSLTQTGEETRAGQIQKEAVSFIVSGIEPNNLQLLLTLSSEPHVFVFQDMEGRNILCGTNHYRAKFKSVMTDSDPPESIKNYKCSITFESTHGLVFCTMP